MTLRIGLLQCDHVDGRLRSIAGDYDEMFEALLPDIELVPYDVVDGTLPESPAACDGWLCTGSRASVYDDRAWIAGLSGFVREVRDAGVPFVGICFGHQLLAHALGGRTARAEHGWGVGAHPVEVSRVEPWMDPPLAAPNLLFMHQDQVLELPPDAVVLASAEHCPVAVLRVGETMVGMQAHPEFGAAYLAALLDDRVARIGEGRAAAARESLAAPTDESTVARWISRFLAGAVASGGRPAGAG